jgi:hypothetical protein
MILNGVLHANGVLKYDNKDLLNEKVNPVLLKNITFQIFDYFDLCEVSFNYKDDLSRMTLPILSNSEPLSIYSGYWRINDNVEIVHIKNNLGLTIHNECYVKKSELAHYLWLQNELTFHDLNIKIKINSSLTYRFQVMFFYKNLN